MTLMRQKMACSQEDIEMTQQPRELTGDKLAEASTPHTSPHSGDQVLRYPICHMDSMILYLPILLV